MLCLSYLFKHKWLSFFGKRGKREIDMDEELSFSLRGKGEDLSPFFPLFVLKRLSF